MTIPIQPILNTLQPNETLTVEENTVYVDDTTVNVLEIAVDVTLVGWCGDAPVYQFEDTLF